MSSPVTNPLTSMPTPASASAAAAAASSSTPPAASEDMFLRLLVAQLKYQDPQSPADGTQFVTELATFNEVDNSTQMVSDLNSIQSLLSSPAALPGGSTPAASLPDASATPGAAVPATAAPAARQA